MKKLLLAVICFIPFSAFANFSVEVVETFPARTDQALAPGQHFYVHLRYTSETPVRIFVRPYTAGNLSNAITSGSVSLPPGSEETLGWFAMRSQGRVDEYRVSTYIKGSGGQEDILTVPVKLQWQPGGTMTNTGIPEWVARINQRNEALAKAEREQAATGSSAGDSILGMIIMPLLFGLPLLAIVLCALAFVRWKGGWRYAGGFPLALFALWLVKFLFDITRDPSSHNLWPFELLMWSVPTLAWLLILILVRKARTPEDPGPAPV